MQMLTLRTVIHCPIFVTGSAFPWTGTVNAALFDVSNTKLADVLGPHWLTRRTFTLDEVRDLLDDPNISIVEDENV